MTEKFNILNPTGNNQDMQIYHHVQVFRMARLVYLRAAVEFSTR